MESWRIKIPMVLRRFHPKTIVSRILIAVMMSASKQDWVAMRFVKLWLKVDRYDS